MLLFASFGVPAAAAGADIQWAPQAIKGGFTVNAPGINNDALLDEIAALKIALMHDKKLLSLQAEQKKVLPIPLLLYFCSRYFHPHSLGARV